MADYSFDAAILKTFASRSYPEDPAERFVYWADLADSVGPSMLPFLVQNGKWNDIPFAELGLKKFRPADLVPQPKEMWVLFCFRQDGVRPPPGSPLRQDGFPLVLEWRKKTKDSPLLSPAFHDLAQKVREQIGASDWGLHPAFGRYGDKVSFADAGLFSDAEHVSSIASAWGALAAGLSCAAENRWPRVWPFPTIQWNRETGRTAGVAGLREKLAVASDFGAEVVSVDRSQLREARKELGILRKEHRLDRGNVPALFAVPPGPPAATAERIAMGAQWKTRRRRRLLFALNITPVLIAAAAAAIGCVRWQIRRASDQAFREVIGALPLHAGAYNQALQAQYALLDAAQDSVKTEDRDIFLSAVPAFEKAMDDAIADMEAAHPDEKAFRRIRKSDFDSKTAEYLFEMTVLQVKQERNIRFTLDSFIAYATLPDNRETALAHFDRRRNLLASGADLYATGIMELLRPADTGQVAKFRSFAKELEFIPRLSGPRLFDQQDIDAEQEDILTRVERIVDEENAIRDREAADLERMRNEFRARLIADGIPPERVDAILDKLDLLSAMKTELEEKENQLKQKKITLYRKHKPLPEDDDNLLWGKMLTFKSFHMPDAALEALAILEQRGSDMYLPGAVRAAKAIVRGNDALPFSDGIMVLSFKPPATSHALFEPGDVVVGFDDRTVGFFSDYKSVPGSTYRFWRLGKDGIFALHKGVLPPNQPLTAFEDVSIPPATP